MSTRSFGPYVAAGGGVLAALALLAIIVPSMAAESQTALLFEVAKAAVSFVPLVFVTVVIADLVRRRDARRAEADRVLAQRRAFRAEAIRAYNETKAVRRALRAEGLRPDSGVRLDAPRLQSLDQLLRRLVDAQLAMERLSREVDGSDYAFADAATIGRALVTIEKGLASVIHDWEEHRPGLGVGDDATALGTWTNYTAFVRPREQVEAGSGLRGALLSMEQALAVELGKPRAGRRGERA